MELIRVGLDIEDREYSSVLARGLARKSRNMEFWVMPSPEKSSKGDADSYFTSSDIDNLLTTGKRDQKSDEESVYGEHNFDDSLDIILRDKNRCTGRENEIALVNCENISDKSECSLDERKAFMYEKCGRMVELIRYWHFLNTGRITEFRDEREVSQILFFSQRGGSGTTSTAISIARMMERMYGKRCLYISLKSMDDSAIYYDLTVNSDFMKLLYYLDSGEDFPISAFINHEDEIDRISVPSVVSDIGDMDAVLFNRLLDRIELSGHYDYLIMDAGCDWNRRNLEIGNSSRMVIFMSEYESKAMTLAETARFEFLKNRGTEIMHIVNRCDPEKNPKEGEFWISEDKRAFNRIGGRIRIDLGGNYGIEIAGITKEIMRRNIENRSAGCRTLCGEELKTSELIS